MVSSDGMMVWAFGDGDYGKLGLGNSTAKSSPQVGAVEGGWGGAANRADFQDSWCSASFHQEDVLSCLNEAVDEQ